jgi:hypothetical protein
MMHHADRLPARPFAHRFVDEAHAAGVDITLDRIPFAAHVYDEGAANSPGNQARRTITQHYLMQHGPITRSL